MDRSHGGPAGPALAGGAPVTADQGAATIIEARDLSLSFGETPALRGASLRVRRGEIVAVIVIAYDPLPADAADQLRTYARQHLTPHKVPQRWFVANELPKTPTGKVRKFALPDLIAQGRVRELFREEPDQ